MQTSQSTTPYGRRPYSLALMETQIVAQSCPAETVAHKWQILDDIRKAKDAIGVSDRTIAVLNALLSFHQETTLTGGEPIVVFPSNKSLARRANGMAETSLRRYLGRLVYLGFILRRDSPNGKRYARRGEGGEIEEAFGFDLSPLVARAAELKRLAAEAIAAERQLHALRDRITISRRDIDKMIATGVYEGVRADWPVLSEAFEGLNRRVPRKATLDMLKPLADALEGLAEEIRTALETHVRTTKMSGNDSQSGRQIQNSTQNPIPESELGLSRKTRAADEPHHETQEQTEPKTQQDRPQRSFPLPMVLDACPDIAEHAPNGINSWRDLMATAASVRPWLGISPSAWEEAIETFGPEDAAVVLAAILQRSSLINSAGGYLRNLTEKARAGAFSLGPMLMALIRANLRKGSQKMRA
ncbi:MAG TPA: plasmid replication protein RepC [Methylocella sp.]|nr:plasmid replication protein RepC [Methylocella sp.]